MLDDGLVGVYDEGAEAFGWRAADGWARAGGGGVQVRGYGGGAWVDWAGLDQRRAGSCGRTLGLEVTVTSRCATLKSS